MKRVLVTGAAGTLGLQVIKYLLSEGKYEITGIDLKTKYNIKRLRGYKKRINIIYGDLNDESLINTLVKDHDYVIYLSGISPVYVNYKNELGKYDYETVTNLVNAIKSKNPKCFLLYASTMSIYGNSNNIVSVNTKANISKFDNYSKYKLMAEKEISKLKNYSIYRLPYILVDPKVKSNFYAIKSNSKIETIGVLDAAYAFVLGISNTDKINKKIFNVTGGEEFRMTYSNYLYKVFKKYGLSMKYVLDLLFSEKVFNASYCKDGNDLEELIHYRHRSLNHYYNSLEKYNRDVKRIIPKIFALPFRIIVKGKKDV